MKNINKTVAMIFTLTFFIAGCGKGDYLALSTSPATTTTTTTTTTTAISITDFNTSWAVEEATPALAPSHLRTLANFLGYSTAHNAKLPTSYSTGCVYGYNGVTSSSPCFSATDILNDYFPATATSFQVFPAAKNMGSVSSYKIRFAANVYDTTGKLKPGTAYLDISVVTPSEVFYVKFTTIKTDLQVVNNTTCGGVLCDVFSVTFKDDCGDLTLKSNIINGSLVNSTLTFLNSVASYKTAGCYFDRTLPNNALKTYNSAIPTTVPLGVDQDSTGTRGELLKAWNGYTGIPVFTQQ
ncbi:MAG: hypothetical protein WCQ47_03290 [bacterium]